jgi:hypothetical protein
MQQMQMMPFMFMAQVIREVRGSAKRIVWGWPGPAARIFGRH